MISRQILLTIAALALAGYLLAQRERMAKVMFEIGERIAGAEGIEIVRSAAVTIGTVSKGVVGVAAIQASLAAIGLIAAGVPGAGLWSLLILILAVAQLPPLLILVPAILYLVATDASMLAFVRANAELIAGDHPLAIQLAFADPRVNLGDIATGRVKTVLDCLCPLLGGEPGDPCDYRVRWLLVRKGIAGVPPGGVRVTVWSLT